jgi:hypothetical protein
MPIIQCVAEVALECLADKRKDRPTMRTVADDLQTIKSFSRRNSPRPNV